MYQKRSSQDDDLYKIIQYNYQQLFFDKEYQGIYLPFHLEREFKKYLNCGILSKGMARPKEIKKKKIYRTPWAELLKHTFKYEVNFCDHCGTKLSLVACITSTYICEKILHHLKIPIQKETVVHPRGPPEIELFDQELPECF